MHLACLVAAWVAWATWACNPGVALEEQTKELDPLVYLMTDQETQGLKPWVSFFVLQILLYKEKHSIKIGSQCRKVPARKPTQLADLVAGMNEQMAM